jgi:hypothetical protein
MLFNNVEQFLRRAPAGLRHGLVILDGNHGRDALDVKLLREFRHLVHVDIQHLQLFYLL